MNFIPNLSQEDQALPKKMIAFMFFVMLPLNISAAQLAGRSNSIAEHALIALV